MSEFYTIQRGLFQLEVSSENLKVAGILPGDMAVFRQLKEGERVEGKFVLALIKREEATLKRIRYLDGGRVELGTGDPKQQPDIYRAGEVEVQGVLVGTIREY